MTDETTPATEPENTETPSAAQLGEALALLERLPEAERRAVAASLSPAEPGSDGKPLTQEQARDLLQENPAKFHALMDAQLAGGPKLIAGV